MESPIYTTSFEEAETFFVFGLRESTKGTVAEITGETQKPQESLEIYTIEIGLNNSIPDVEIYFRLISKFIEYIQSKSEKEIRISVSLNKDIPEGFYDTLITKLQKSHADEVIKNYKEKRMIIVCN